MEHSTDEDDPTQDTQDHFVGMIAHLKIWRSVLSEEEIRYYTLFSFAKIFISSFLSGEK